MRFPRLTVSSRPLALAVGALLCLHGPTPAQAQNTSAAVRQFIVNQPYLPVLPAGSRSSQPTLHDANGNQISDTVVNETLNVAELSGLNPNAGVLWPGSLVQGRGLTSGTLSAISVARAPGTLVLSPLGGTARGQRRTAVVTAPAAGSVEAARSRLLQSGFFVPQSVGFEMHQIYSLDDALLQIGAQASYLSAQARG